MYWKVENKEKEAGNGYFSKITNHFKGEGIREYFGNSWVKEDGSPGLVVIGGGSCSKGREFESRHHILEYWMDIFSHIFVVKIVKVEWIVVTLTTSPSAKTVPPPASTSSSQPIKVANVSPFSRSSISPNKKVVLGHFFFIKCHPSCTNRAVVWLSS